MLARSNPMSLHCWLLQSGLAKANCSVSRSAFAYPILIFRCGRRERRFRVRDGLAPDKVFCPPPLHRPPKRLSLCLGSAVGVSGVNVQASEFSTDPFQRHRTHSRSIATDLMVSRVSLKGCAGTFLKSRTIRKLGDHRCAATNFSAGIGLSSAMAA